MRTESIKYRIKATTQMKVTAMDARQKQLEQNEQCQQSINDKNTELQRLQVYHNLYSKPYHCHFYIIQ